ncbi:hypothetical protein [Bacillus sp. CHD6a]|uniref:hypothetical protein n=1 Tax=Bacillus sp. CHD6a TaxID=1643452 RepID=UPI0006CD4B24|nr:hypothetical protein [Bacillus sp. CHD6a]KPB06027.1 hypothetical protein AAV98_03660 [Bacillus sp. CHD6a]
MKEQTSQMFVIFIAISFIIGIFNNDFIKNEALLLSMTFAALAFTLLDLCKLLNLNKNINYILLFFAVFSIVALPYLEGIHKLVASQSDRITILGLAIVILIIGIRQRLDEKRDIFQINNYIDETKSIINSQSQIINEQNEIIEKLNNKLNSSKDNEKK